MTNDYGPELEQLVSLIDRICLVEEDEKNKYLFVMIAEVVRSISEDKGHSEAIHDLLALQRGMFGVYGVKQPGEGQC